MAVIKVSCPQCATGYEFDETQRGKQARCQQCGLSFAIAAPPTAILNVLLLVLFPSSRMCCLRSASCVQAGKSRRDETPPARTDQCCPYCGGKGEVRGFVDDVEFIFQCPCSGGSEVAVRWLLGLKEPPGGADWVI